MKRNYVSLLSIAALALAATLAIEAQQPASTPDRTQTPSTANNGQTPDAPPAPMTKSDIKAQRKIQKHEEKAAKANAKAAKRQSQAKQAQDKAQQEQEKAVAPPQ